MNNHRLTLPVNKTSDITVAGEKNCSDFITVVSGIPRSGTSMMMKMLDHGNMPLLIDNFREPDVDNPRGYYEFERVKELEHDNSWLEMARGKAIKIVSPLLQHLPLDMKFSYKIIFMLRDLEEVLASQRKMSDRLNPCEDRIKENILKQNYTGHIEEVRQWMEQKENIDFIYVNYRDVINSPASVAEDICTFLDLIMNTLEMSMVVDNLLYRHRMDQMTEPVHPASEAETDKEVIMDQLRQLGYL